MMKDRKLDGRHSRRNPISRYVTSFVDDTIDVQATDSVHWIASATKLVTTIAVIQCVEKDLLHLDEDIATILPEWKKPRVLVGFNEQKLPQFQHAKRAITLSWAGLMVENVNKDMKLGEFMKKYIFELLSIYDIIFYLDQRDDLRPRVVRFLERSGSDLKQIKSFYPGPISVDLGGGGLYAYVPELLKLMGVFSMVTS
ncbi:beta-lactamase/transpeptidase-like protein [Dactylonectria estremocensis]|uniref:Beta-lactamase/transpeptidase-like protein n=1 Tax=Dactylonectria estremocensis TaxID=1079267 RepID=A0A9P9FE45_9HYPO|nr:beta-lactamase/transpeptidase-like protein [Dactylonectria estremocensis]